MTKKTTDYIELLAEKVAFRIPMVWDGIAADIGQVTESGTIPSDELVELCVDANRLASFGYQEAEDAKDLLMAEMKWPEFCKLVASKLAYKHWEC